MLDREDAEHEAGDGHNHARPDERLLAGESGAAFGGLDLPGVDRIDPEVARGPGNTAALFNFDDGEVEDGEEGAAADLLAVAPAGGPPAAIGGRGLADGAHPADVAVAHGPTGQVDERLPDSLRGRSHGEASPDHVVRPEETGKGVQHRLEPGRASSERLRAGYHARIVQPCEGRDHARTFTRAIGDRDGGGAGAGERLRAGARGRRRERDGLRCARGGSRSSSRLEEAGGEAQAFVADVGVAEDVRRVVDGHVERFGGVDVLVSNAGVWRASTATDDLDKTLDDYDFVVNTNLKGVYLFGRAVIPHMIAGGGGNIVHIASDHVCTCGTPSLRPHEDTPNCPFTGQGPRPTGGGPDMDLYDALEVGDQRLHHSLVEGAGGAPHPRERSVHGRDRFAHGAHVPRAESGLGHPQTTPCARRTWRRS